MVELTCTVLNFEFDKYALLNGSHRYLVHYLGVLLYSVIFGRTCLEMFKNHFDLTRSRFIKTGCFAHDHLNSNRSN